MARLENATFEEIVTHLERELELNGLEEGDDIHVPTMSTAPIATRPGTGLLSSGIDPGTTCNYCKKNLDIEDDCRKLKRKEEIKRNDGQSTKQEYPKFPTCDQTNHPAERCWKGAGAHLMPKNLKLDIFKSEETSMSQDDSNDKPTTSIFKKLDLPRLRFNDNLRVRHNIIFDPSTFYYTEYYLSLKENSSADWQQQVKNIPDTLHGLDPQSDGEHCNKTTIRPLPFIDNYNPYYPDPDFGFDPYWDIQIYNQHHLCFYNHFTKNNRT